MEKQLRFQINKREVRQMNIYTYLVKGYKTMSWITVNANNEDDAQIKAVLTFNEYMDDVALRVYEP